MTSHEVPRSFPLPFPEQEFENRLNRVRLAMEREGVDVAIATDPRDFYWLTGSRMKIKTVENPAWVIVWQKEPIGVIRHLEGSTHRCCSILSEWVEYPDEGPINPYDPVLYTTKTLKQHKLDRKVIGLNFRTIALEEFNRFKQLLPEAEFVDFRIEKIRIIKSKLEQACQIEAAKVNQDALIATINEVEPGWSEYDIIARVSELHEQALGDDFELSHSMIQVGRHVAHMHIKRWPPEQKSEIVKEGDIAYLETGTFVNRYVGSMLRMVSFGEPNPIVQKAVEASIEAVGLAIEATAPGKTAHEVDKAARDYLHGLKLDCQSRIGYGNGLVWSEGMVLSIEPNNPIVLEPGHIFHCIALVHEPGWGYIGVSEQVLVTEDGCEVLADHDRTCPRKLFVR
jgi:ectoine hydrolase